MDPGQASHPPAPDLHALEKFPFREGLIRSRARIHKLVWERFESSDGVEVGKRLLEVSCAGTDAASAGFT